MSSLVSAEPVTFTALYQRLQSLPSPLRPPSGPSDASLTDSIASLYIHPAIEAGLHLLNNDLYAAHFLCRHMQASPALEGMYLHGILHRLEGDYDNARAWYRDVASSDVYKTVWGEQGRGGQDLIDETENFVKSHQRESAADAGDLEKRSAREITAVVDFCVTKFGTEKVQNARPIWKQPDGDLKKLGQDMVSGDKGHRDF